MELYTGEPMPRKTQIAVDIRPLLVEFQGYTNMYGFYQRYPLKELIAQILSVNQFINFHEFVWFEVERRFHGDLELFDPNAIDLFFEMLAQRIDEYIGWCVPSAVDTSEFIFDRWVDSTTILLKQDETVHIYRDRGANDYIPDQREYHLLDPQSRWFHP